MVIFSRILRRGFFTFGFHLRNLVASCSGWMLLNLSARGFDELKTCFSNYLLIFLEQLSNFTFKFGSFHFVTFFCFWLLSDFCFPSIIIIFDRNFSVKTKFWRFVIIILKMVLWAVFSGHLRPNFLSTNEFALINYGCNWLEHLSSHSKKLLD